MSVLVCEEVDFVLSLFHPLQAARPLDQENYLFNMFNKQHGPLQVKRVFNAMESFQQKVPPILLGAFEDIFD
jgi:hypothetical protein